jgi:UDP-GlcNAc:undecaprenyl-phosphate GlcNAc-1-phosphate transferase
MLLLVLALGAVSLIVSLVASAMMIRIAPQFGLIDKPGGRKIHDNPKPLGGGVAIFVAFALPMIAGIVVTRYSNLWQSAPVHTTNVYPDRTKTESFTPGIDPAYLSGARQQIPLALTFLACCLALHVIGLIDDRKALGPFVKLIAQLLIAGLLVMRFREVRALTALGYWPSVVMTVLWIVGITNAFNFLDNMDGLSAGVAAVCTTAFLVTAITIEQWFVAATLALLLGALIGFLFFNFAPARIFMGDSGSLVIGFILGVLTVRTTYLSPGEDFARGWYAVFAPVIVLALPLYDLVVVSIIRISRGQSPFVGDTNHFSHRLVARGMSRRTAVLCLYLVTAATSIAAILLPHVRTTFAAILIFAQTILVLGLVALLEQHPMKRMTNDEPRNPNQ